LNDTRAISLAIALRLSRYFSKSPQFWMNLWTRYDLTVAEQELGQKIAKEVELVAH
jgi:addiction module HigA family antidote